jgi:hypothetical protein
MIDYPILHSDTDRGKGPFGFIAPNKTLNYSFEFERRLFQERVVRTKFGIYVSIVLLNSIASLNCTMKKYLIVKFDLLGAIKPKGINRIAKF